MKRTIDQVNDNNFMHIFKYYKCNNNKPSFENVISFEKDKVTEKVEAFNPQYVIDDARIEFLGLKPINEWKTYKFVNHPGLMLIKNPFTSLGQRYWIRKCLEQYSRKPNKTNLDIEIILNDWWKECYRKGECDSKLLKKMRWTTLGYHHNWDTKIYSEDNKSVFPEDLAELCDCIAQYLGYKDFKAEAAIVNYYHLSSTLSAHTDHSEINLEAPLFSFSEDNKSVFPEDLAELCDCIAQYLGYKDFKAEAAIVNYYHLSSTLSAHTDHSEINLEAPLFSFSFGQSAIFLIGGREKSVTPSAILLESGDIAIMSKEARLSYHAVPKIVATALEPWNNLENPSIDDKPITFMYITDKQQLINDMNKNIDKNEWYLFGKRKLQRQLHEWAGSTGEIPRPQRKQASSGSNSTFRLIARLQPYDIIK
ncbi:Alkylated DNA repair protein alkB-like 1 [Papilio machaon]|uniref:Alkylated DNA repair protein alkB-like 1 n=1 Tax=Papilio machaon TaxID=76193 RepID=A0A194RRY6_PAPMA|nr:Alkylated DNA repair protein alkB-like 1 [Papilio machaon]